MTRPTDPTPFPDESPADLTAAEREWEAALSSLRPAGAEDRALRDQTMFRAGEAAGRLAAAAERDAARGTARLQLWAWRASAAALLAVVVGLSLRLAGQPATSADQTRAALVPASGPATAPGGQRSVRPTDAPRRMPGATADESQVPPDWPDAADRGPAAGSPLASLVGLSGPDNNYLRTREAVLRWGIRVLPRPAADAEAADAPPAPRAWPAAPVPQTRRPAPTHGSPDEPAADPFRRLRQWLLPDGTNEGREPRNRNEGDQT